MTPFGDTDDTTPSPAHTTCRHWGRHGTRGGWGVEGLARLTEGGGGEGLAGLTEGGVEGLAGLTEGGEASRADRRGG